MMLNIRNILTGVFIILSLGVHGQFNYKKGRVITLENDTLTGLIMDAGGIRNSKVCVYKENRNSDPIRFYPKDLVSYRFFNDKYYRAMDLTGPEDSGRVFSTVLLEGSVNLYYYRKNPQMAFYIEKEGSMIGLRNKKITLPVSSEGYYSLQSTNTYIPVYSEKFFNQTNTIISIDLYKDTLYHVFNESEKIQKELDNVRYNEKSLLNISKEYIKETCGNNICIRYEKNRKLSKPSFGVFTGVQLSKISFTDYTVKSGNTIDVNETSLKSDILFAAPIGVFYNIPINSLTERLSFQVELIGNILNYKQGFVIAPDSFINVGIQSKSISVPLMLKYRFPFNSVSPTLAFGKEQGFVLNSEAYYGNEQYLLLHIYPKGGWFCEFGIDYKVGPNIKLFSNIRLQSNHNLIIKKENDYHLPYSRVYNFQNYVSSYATNFASLYIGIQF